MSMIDLFQELNEVAGENLQLFTRHIQQDYLEGQSTPNVIKCAHSCHRNFLYFFSE